MNSFTPDYILLIWLIQNSHSKGLFWLTLHHTGTYTIFHCNQYQNVFHFLRENVGIYPKICLILSFIYANCIKEVSALKTFGIQIRMCLSKFCQVDKISTSTWVFTHK